MSQQVSLYKARGCEAERDCDLDSQESPKKFGDNTVPFAGAAVSQVGKKQVGYNRMLAMCFLNKINRPEINFGW
ncbi:hypothetical protein [Microcoleus sp. A006_D1]|uniref:hypothetical protein n=1 Tax=Microcoleus sp. A006_D1 TaxID=3055267 RepID=UPI003FA583F2